MEGGLQKEGSNLLYTMVSLLLIHCAHSIASSAHVFLDMIHDSVQKINLAKQLVPQGLLVKCLLLVERTAWKVIADPINSIIRDEKVPKD